MFKKVLAALAAVLLGVGISLTAVAAPASAHTGDLTAAATCVNGEYKVTYTLKITQTDLKGTAYWRIGTTSFDGTPTNNTGMSNSVATNGSGSYVLTTITLPGTSTKAPWAYAYTIWTDQFGKGSDGGDIALGGNCDTPKTPVTVNPGASATPPTCTEAGKLVIPTQTGVVFSGGANGAGPGTYTIVAAAAPGYTLTAPYSKTITVLPANGDLCEKVTIPVSSKNQMTCVAGVASGSYTLPAAGQWVEWYVNDVKTTTPSPVTTPGTVKVEAKITAAGLAAGVKFTDGTTVKTYNHQFTAPENCLKVTTPVSSKSQMTCVAGVASGSYTLPATTWVDWYVDGVKTTTPSAVTTAGTVKVEAKINAAGLAAGIVFTDGTTVKTFNHLFTAPENCFKIAAPTTTKSQTCVAGGLSGSYTLPATTWVDWYVNDVKTTTPTTVTVAGDVKVEAKINAAGLAAGIVFTDGSTSKLTTHTFTTPENCQKIAAPTTQKSQTCVAGGLSGSYTLPATTWVDWYVDGVKTTTPTTVTVAGDVKVEAKINAAGLAAGIVFTDGSTVSTTTHTFTTPEDCQKIAAPTTQKSQTCVAGGLSGSYTLPATTWVDWYVDGVKTTTPTTVTVAGDVVVEAKINTAGLAAGIVFTDGSTVSSTTHTFTTPEDCEKVTIPVSTKSVMECVLNAPTGSYTLPPTKWVEWYVNGALTTTPTDVHTAGDVVVEARITAAGIAAGIVFTDGSTSKTVTHTFVLPVESCDPPTLAILHPTATQVAGSCTADPTYTLSNTTSVYGGVQWWIGDPQIKTTPGTHKASWGSTIVVEATVVDPVHDGIDPSPATWTFKFPAKPACGDLITLALTGSSPGGFVPWIAGALLLLGGAGLYFQRRLVTAKK